MIISESRICVPGKRFRTKIKCVSTRRLTTVEWLVLNCTSKFSGSSKDSKNVKEVFENIFQFQNSELLIKPCLKSLSDLKVITVNNGEVYDYKTLSFSEIRLTELGQIMLKDGLLPGEQRENSLEIFFNPLTGRLTTIDWQSNEAEKGIPFGTERDYDLRFPEQDIIDGLQSGSVAAGKFTAAKFRIEEIEELSEEDWECSTDIAVDLDDNGTISTIPEIVAESMYSQIPVLLGGKEISDKVLKTLTPIQEAEISGIKGSGNVIKQTVQDICKNSKVVFIDEHFYDVYKRNTSFFKNKIVVVFGSDGNFEIEIKKEKKDLMRFVHLPDKFTVPGVVLLNEKGESISLCKAVWDYKGEEVVAPVALEDKRMQPSLRMVDKWVTKLVLDNIDNIEYLSLTSLPGIKAEMRQVTKALGDKWNDCKLEFVVNNAKTVRNACNRLEIIPMDYYSLWGMIEEKIDIDNPDVALNQLSGVIETGVLSKQTDAYYSIAEKLLERMPAPTNYSELITISQNLGIITYEDALKVSDLEDRLYTHDVIEEILMQIVAGTDIRLPIRFSWDIFFTDYMECIRDIEIHIEGLKLFENHDVEKLQQAIKRCPNLGTLQMHYSELVEKNEYLMEQGINYYAVMKNANSEKADNFYNNINLIGEALKEIISAEYNTAKTKAVKKGSVGKQKVFVMDTCALIHAPKILLYFADDEYVRIPTKVIDEIGKIKDKRNGKYDADASLTARSLARSIYEVYMGLFNSKNSIRLLIENADTSLLPEDLDPSVPDNQILSVALKYPDCETTIISDDTVFRLASISQDVKTMTSEEFMEDHKSSYKSLENWKSSVKAKPPLLVSPKEETVANDKKTVNEEAVSIDSMPIKELMKYAADLTNPVLSFLNTNSVKTIGQFRQLTDAAVDGFKAKGTQMVYKNTIKYTLGRIDQIIEKMQEEYT